MGPLILGIILLVVYYMVAMPYPLPVIILIAAIIALLYGLWILFAGYRGPVVGPGEPVTRRRMRWY